MCRLWRLSPPRDLLARYLPRGRVGLDQVVQARVQLVEPDVVGRNRPRRGSRRPGRGGRVLRQRRTPREGGSGPKYKRMSRPPLAVVLRLRYNHAIAPADQSQRRGRDVRAGVARPPRVGDAGGALPPSRRRRRLPRPPGPPSPTGLSAPAPRPRGPPRATTTPAAPPPP